MKKNAVMLLFCLSVITISSAQDFDFSHFRELTFEKATDDWVANHLHRTTGYYSIVGHLRRLGPSVEFASNGGVHTQIWSRNFLVQPPDLNIGDVIRIFYTRSPRGEIGVVKIEKLDKDFIVGQIYFTMSNLNIRNEEGTAYTRLDTLNRYTAVLLTDVGRHETIDGIASRWVKVRVSTMDTRTVALSGLVFDGLEGWVFGGFLDYWNMTMSQH